jgi:hypothetical protein
MREFHSTTSREQCTFSEGEGELGTENEKHWTILSAGFHKIYAFCVLPYCSVLSIEAGKPPCKVRQLACICTYYSLKKLLASRRLFVFKLL